MDVNLTATADTLAAEIEAGARREVLASWDQDFPSTAGSDDSPAGIAGRGFTFSTMQVTDTADKENVLIRELTRDGATRREFLADRELTLAFLDDLQRGVLPYFLVRVDPLSPAARIRYWTGVEGLELPTRWDTNTLVYTNPKAPYRVRTVRTGGDIFVLVEGRGQPKVYTGPHTTIQLTVENLPGNLTRLRAAH